MALCRKYGVSVFFRCEGCSQLALTSSESLPVHFRVLLLLCWFTFPFIRASFLICYSISPGCLSILWTSWVRVWGWVSDRVPTDPLFVRLSHALLRFFFFFFFFFLRWARGGRVSSGLSPFLGWIVCVIGQWLLPLCSLSRVYFSTVLGRLLFCSLWGTVDFCVICWVEFAILPFLSFFLISWLMFDVYIPLKGCCWWVREQLL